eukprot:3941014-Rhodomonas_salina.1
MKVITVYLLEKFLQASCQLLLLLVPPYHNATSEAAQKRRITGGRYYSTGDLIASAQRSVLKHRRFHSKCVPAYTRSVPEIW